MWKGSTAIQAALTSLRYLRGREVRFEMVSILLLARLRWLSLDRESRPEIAVIWLPAGVQQTGERFTVQSGSYRGSAALRLHPCESGFGVST